MILSTAEKEKKISPDASSEPLDRQDAVQIMSIHKSKGLEFPVVFVMGLGGQFNFLDERRDIVWERDGGIGPMLAERSKRLKHPTIAHVAVADRLREMSLAEEIRIYYVALTRAKERLILSAAVRNPAQKIEAWADVEAKRRLPAQYLLGASSPLAWFGAALLRHPNAACWRELAGIGEDLLLNTEGAWQIDLIDEATLSAAEKIDSPAIDDSINQVTIPQEISLALSFHYPYTKATSYPAKWSVSSLRRLAAEQEYTATAAYVSEDNEGKEDQTKPDPALRGNAYHTFLENIDFNAVDSKKAVEDQLAKLAQSNRIGEEEKKAVDAELIARFFNGEVGQRLVKSSKAIREWQFTILTETCFDEQIVVQGILDVAFWDNDGWVILDYKTGGQGKSDNALRHIYAEQLNYYKDAVERLLGQKVKETWLVMLDLGRSILVE